MLIAFKVPITKFNFKQDQENNNHLIQTLVTNFNPNSLKTDLFFCRLCRALIDILPDESLFWHGGVFVKRRLRTAGGCEELRGGFSPQSPRLLGFSSSRAAGRAAVTLLFPRPRGGCWVRYRPWDSERRKRCPAAQSFGEETRSRAGTVQVSSEVSE